MIHKIDNPLELCQLKFDSNEKGSFEGYASVFNGLDAVNDIILPGAYSKTLKKGHRISMFINHESHKIPVGDWTGLKEDKTGLHAKGLIDENHMDGPSAYSAMKRGAMSGLSIGFKIPKGGATEKEDGTREIKEIDLKEISIVNFPADDDARISQVKYEIEDADSLKDVEKYLRESGFSKSKATAIVSRISKLHKRDAEKALNEITTIDATDDLIAIIKNL